MSAAEYRSQWWQNVVDDAKNDPIYVAEEIAQQAAIAMSKRLKELSMTQKKLAEKIQLSPGRISQIMAGNLNLTLLTLCKVSLGVGLYPSFNFSGTASGVTSAAGHGAYVDLGTASAGPFYSQRSMIFSAAPDLPMAPQQTRQDRVVFSAVADGSEKGAAA